MTATTQKNMTLVFDHENNGYPWGLAGTWSNDGLIGFLKAKKRFGTFRCRHIVYDKKQCRYLEHTAQDFQLNVARGEK